MKESGRKLFRVILMLLGITLSYTGSAFCAYAGIGQGPVGAFQYATSEWLGVAMGTVAFVFQSFFVFGQFCIERKNFKIYQLLQLVISFYGALVLNFVLYQLLGRIPWEMPYVLRLLLLIGGFMLNAFGVALTLQTNSVRVPLEGFLKLLSQNTKYSLGRYKQISDFVLLFVSAIICVWQKIPLTVREGTLLNAFLFGIFLDFFIKKIKLFPNQTSSQAE